MYWTWLSSSHAVHTLVQITRDVISCSAYCPRNRKRSSHREISCLPPRFIRWLQGQMIFRRCVPPSALDTIVGRYREPCSVLPFLAFYRLLRLHPMVGIRFAQLCSGQRQGCWLWKRSLPSGHHLLRFRYAPCQERTWRRSPYPSEKAGQFRLPLQVDSRRGVARLLRVISGEGKVV